MLTQALSDSIGMGRSVISPTSRTEGKRTASQVGVVVFFLLFPALLILPRRGLGVLVLVSGSVLLIFTVERHMNEWLINDYFIIANGGRKFAAYPISLDAAKNAVELISKLLSCFESEAQYQCWLSEVSRAAARSVAAHPPKRVRSGFIYLCRNERNGMTKIGFSIKPRFRETTLQSEDPDVRMIFTASGTIQTERALRDQFKDKRGRGEWFHLTEEDIESIRASMPGGR
jgi:hypothetical protein